MDTRKVIRRLQVPIPPVPIDADYPAIKPGDEVLKSGADNSHYEFTDSTCGCRYCKPESQPSVTRIRNVPNTGVRRYDENGELVAWK